MQSAIVSRSYIVAKSLPATFPFLCSMLSSDRYAEISYSLQGSSFETVSAIFIRAGHIITWRMKKGLPQTCQAVPAIHDRRPSCIVSDCPAIFSCTRYVIQDCCCVKFTRNRTTVCLRFPGSRTTPIPGAMQDAVAVRPQLQAAANTAGLLLAIDSIQLVSLIRKLKEADMPERIELLNCYLLN